MQSFKARPLAPPPPRLFNAKKAQARVKKVGNMVKVNIKNSRTRPVTLF